MYLRENFAEIFQLGISSCPFDEQFISFLRNNFLLFSFYFVARLIGELAGGVRGVCHR